MRFALKTSSVPTPQAPTNPIRIMCLMRMPATKNRMPAVSAITMVAPKSGSATANPISRAATPTAGNAPFQNRSTRHPIRSSRTADETTTSIFANSLGCIRIEPRRSHRCDPFVAGKANTDAMRTTTNT